ncbi:MAG: cytochrome c [Bacteroidota bacterium]|nr:cytochrome c [Bacteroidota bacterium]
MKSRQIVILFFVISLFSSVIYCQDKNNSMMHGNGMMMQRGNHQMMNWNRQRQSGQWIAPPGTNKLNNPLIKSSETLAAGKTIFQSQCYVCHGKQGKGDGPAGATLHPKPADLTSQKVSQQSDGAIFWKITTGNSPMPSYKLSLSGQQRWQLVNYIRSLQQNQ